MTWKTLKNSNFFMEKVASLGRAKADVEENFGGDLHNDHFIFSRRLNSEEVLYCWDTSLKIVSPLSKSL